MMLLSLMIRYIRSSLLILFLKEIHFEWIEDFLSFSYVTNFSYFSLEIEEYSASAEPVEIVDDSLSLSFISFVYSYLEDFSIFTLGHFLCWSFQSTCPAGPWTVFFKRILLELYVRLETFRRRDLKRD